MKERTLLFFALVLVTANVFAQNPIVFKNAKMKTGDNPEWKDRHFNDKDWTSILLGRDWDSQGFAQYNGFGFYRMHFSLPSAMLQQSYWKDSLLFYMGKIDDADEVYLNGKLIGKTGSFPADQGGYATAYSVERIYKVAANDPALLWDADNVIAVKVYDGDGNGGMYEGSPYIRMKDLTDVLAIATDFKKNKGANTCTITIANSHNAALTGSLEMAIVDKESDKVTQTFRQNVKLATAKPFYKELPYSTGVRNSVKIVFTEARTGVTISNEIVLPYILTPKASDLPQINGAKVFGVRPGSPVLFKIPASGQKPIRYSVENLPAGLQVDAGTGVITGVLHTPGEYTMTFIAENAKGKGSRTFTLKVGNLLALTPPMGWNSWNCWGLSVSDEKVRSSAQALIDKGLMDYGWMYINVDDAWENSQREADGSLRANSKFPDMKGLGDWLHSHGLKFGIYSSPGPLTCGKYLGSYQHEKQDADLYASWGVDYLKYDWCDYFEVYYKEGDQSLSAHMKPYQVMEKALVQQKRDIVYSLCQYGMRDVWQWGAAVNGSLWRTTGDIVDTWASLKEIGFDRQAELYPFAKPGRWNDPDMLIVGKVGWSNSLRQTRLTYDEQYTHISLWSLLSAPLLIGCDMSQLDDYTLNLLTNAEVIAVNQDPLGRQARRVVDKDDQQVWVKQLEDGSYAVGIFNLSKEDRTQTIEWAALELPGKVSLRDLWRQKDLGISDGRYEVKVPSHGVVLLKVK
ncbi:MAG: putative Ig domain-containing protein [Candidatus Pseudobacter hemicellulosilyticus]|uniref:Alpha-galactosidase n=1 Tax=Candidatus Pseudobacter hemicellulosilyticus TaxID=3121375 RepID=A0AAJ5WL72_9BACT|nr:MAG: putative Ig domain-containing protein [Pseudobacter sp.]